MPTIRWTFLPVTREMVPQQSQISRGALEAEQALRGIDERLPEPMTLNSSLTELGATADAYARLDPEHRNSGE